MASTAGHEKKPADGLDANILNLNFGGESKEKYVTLAMRDGEATSALYPDAKVEFVGGKHPICFEDGDLPPWYAPNTYKKDYIGQPKGVKQYLWERGQWLALIVFLHG